MFKKENVEKTWREGTYLISADDSFEADIIESKLSAEGIPCIKKYTGASNFLEISMGLSFTNPIDIYVPESTMEDAENIIIAIPVTDEEFDAEDEPEGAESEEE